MKKTLPLLLAIVLAFTIGTTLLSQADRQIRLIVRSNKEQPYKVLDLDGAKQWPFAYKQLRTHRTNKSDKIRYFDFARGYLPVRHGARWKLLNIDGEVVKDLATQFSSVDMPSSGFYRCTDYNRYTKKSTYHFLDAQLNPVFPDRPFDHASPFDNGKAVVQENGRLIVIDEEGNELQELPEHLNTYLYEIEDHDNGICAITIKVPVASSSQDFYTTEYFDLEKQAVLRAQDGQYYGKRAGYLGQNELFNGGYEVVRSGSTIKFIDRSGKVLGTAEHVEQIFGRNEHYVSLAVREPETHAYKTQLVDYQGRKVQLPIEQAGNDHIFHVGPNFICLKKDDDQYLFCHPETLDILAESKYPAFFFLEGYFVLGYPAHRTYFYRGTQFINSSKPTFDADDIIYTDFQDALKQPKAVKIAAFELSGIKDIRQIEKMSNLRKLTLKNSPAATLNIDFQQLENLEELILFDHPALTKLPVSLSGHPALKGLSLTTCQKIENLEELLISLPKLESVAAYDHRLSETFRARLKTKQPEIRILDARNVIFDGMFVPEDKE